MLYWETDDKKNTIRDEGASIECNVPAKDSANKHSIKFATCNDIQGIGKTDPTQAFVVPSPIDVRVIEWILC